jgi:hypothetical protein
MRASTSGAPGLSRGSMDGPAYVQIPGIDTRPPGALGRELTVLERASEIQLGPGGDRHAGRGEAILLPILVVMKVGTSTVTLRDLSIFPIRMNAGIDVLCGNLGQDFVDSFENVSLNLSTMTFSSGAPRRIHR